MNKDKQEYNNTICADMTVLEVVSCYRHTELVFKKYDEKAGDCICCQMLFKPLKDVAKKYGLDLDGLLADLRKVI